MQSGPSTPTLRWLNLLLIYISFVLHFFLTFINFVLSFFLIFYKDPLKVAARAPLMLAVPGLTDSGLKSRHLVEFVDIFPTIVEAAGLPTLQASSLLRSYDKKVSFQGLSRTIELLHAVHGGLQLDAIDREP